MGKRLTTREKLAKRLEELLGPDFQVNPADLYSNRGPKEYSDIASWQGYARFRSQQQVSHSFHSYDTMTDCARHGVVWIGRGQIELAANTPSPSN